jgi:hypothetical protein
MRCEAFRYSTAPRDAKGKTVFSSDSKLVADTDWNESKMPGEDMQNGAFTRIAHRFRRRIARGSSNDAGLCNRVIISR